MTHKKFHEILTRELIIHSQEENVTASGISRGRPSPTASQLSQLKVKHHSIGLPKENHGGVVCVRCTRKQEACCISAGSVTLVYAWWTVSSSGTRV